jgi:signal transduction histidine kinase
MRLAQHAASSLEAVDDLINTLLELSRIDAGALQVTPVTFIWTSCCAS